jgi:hypothetical protein
MVSPEFQEFHCTTLFLEHLHNTIEPISILDGRSEAAALQTAGAPEMLTEYLQASAVREHQEYLSPRVVGIVCSNHGLNSLP